MQVRAVMRVPLVLRLQVVELHVRLVFKDTLERQQVAVPVAVMV